MSTTTTTTTVDESTTTTTTEKPAEETTTTTTTSDQRSVGDATATTTTTVDANEAGHIPVEKQGEQVIDKTAEAHELKEQSADERLDEAKAEGLRNHAAEHANDEGDVTSRDKTEE